MAKNYGFITYDNKYYHYYADDMHAALSAYVIERCGGFGGYFTLSQISWDSFYKAIDTTSPIRNAIRLGLFNTACKKEKLKIKTVLYDYDLIFYPQANQSKGWRYEGNVQQGQLTIESPTTIVTAGGRGITYDGTLHAVLNSYLQEAPEYTNKFNDVLTIDEDMWEDINNHGDTFILTTYEDCLAQREGPDDHEACCRKFVMIDASRIELFNSSCKSKENRILFACVNAQCAYGTLEYIE